MVKASNIQTRKNLFWGTGLIFFSMNCLVGGWLSRLPDIQVQLGLNEAQLGLSLIGLPTGAFLGNLLSASLLKRYNVGKVTYISIHFTMALMVIMSLSNAMLTLCFGLLWVGLANGLTNVSMNSTADTLERQYHIRIMSSCHGMFSLGGFTGAVIGGVSASIGITLFWQLLIQAISLTLILYPLRRFVLPVQVQKSSLQLSVKRLSKKDKRLLGIPAVIGFCIMISEGAISDWSPLFMKEERLSSSLLAAMAYGGFSLFMAIGRFRGDHIRQRIKGSILLMAGVAIGFGGLVVAICAPWPLISVLGFSLSGLGFSIVVPVLFSLAATLTPNRPDQGIAFIANIGIFGFLMAPPTIGFLADRFGLELALGTVSFLSLIALFYAWRLKKQQLIP